MRYIISGFTDEAGRNAGEQIGACIANGISHIEMRNINGKNLADLSLAEAKEIKKALDQSGVKVSAAGSPFGKTSIKDDFAPVLESFKQYVEKMRILETDTLRMFSFYDTLNDPAGWKDEVASRISSMMEAAPGIVFCHENERGIFGNVPERCKELYDAFGGRLKLVFDPANFICDKVDVLRAYEMLEDSIEYFHIKDALLESGEIVPAGRGDGKVGDILTRFAKKGKDAFLSVEPHLKINDKGENMAVKTGYIYATQPEAFGVACSALTGLLAAGGFTRKDAGAGAGAGTGAVGDTAETAGRGVWISPVL